MTAVVDIHARLPGGVSLGVPWRDAAALRRPIVVEVFGPAGSGKTTFAQALHRALRSAGRPSVLVSSARPAECASPAARSHSSVPRALLATLSRAAKVFSALAELGSDDPAGARLLAQFPPASPVSHLRHRRYLGRLARAVAARDLLGGVVVLDQGYLSALCSLAARSGLARRADAGELLQRALGAFPPPDLVVWMETPEAVVEQRLRIRLARQSPAERLFELDLPTLMEQARLAGMLRGLLTLRVGHLIAARGVDSPGPDGDVARVARAVCALAGAPIPGQAP